MHGQSEAGSRAGHAAWFRRGSVLSGGKRVPYWFLQDLGLHSQKKKTSVSFDWPIKDIFGTVLFKFFTSPILCKLRY